MGVLADRTSSCTLRRSLPGSPLPLASICLQGFPVADTDPIMSTSLSHVFVHMSSDVGYHDGCANPDVEWLSLTFFKLCLEHPANSRVLV